MCTHAYTHKKKDTKTHANVVSTFASVLTLHSVSFLFSWVICGELQPTENPAGKNSIDQHQNTTYVGLAGDQLCFGAGLCCFFPAGKGRPAQFFMDISLKKLNDQNLKRSAISKSYFSLFVQITLCTLTCTHMHRGGSERQFRSDQMDKLLSDHNSTSIAVVSEKQKHVVIWAATICWLKHGGNISILLLMVLLHASTACLCQHTKAGI